METNKKRKGGKNIGDCKDEYGRRYSGIKKDFGYDQINKFGHTDYSFIPFLLPGLSKLGTKQYD